MLCTLVEGLQEEKGGGGGMRFWRLLPLLQPLFMAERLHVSNQPSQPVPIEIYIESLYSKEVRGTVNSKVLKKLSAAIVMDREQSR